MPILVVTNASSAPTVVYDPTGITAFKLDVAAGVTETVTLTSLELQCSGPILTELVADAVISYRVQDDPDVADNVEPLGAAGMELKVLNQVITFASLTDADTSQNIAIAGFPARSFPIAAGIELVAAFDGGTASGVTASVGDAGAATELCTAIEMITGTGVGVIYSVAGANAGEFVFEAAYSPICQVVSTGDDLDTFTAGEFVVHLWYMTPALYDLG